MLASNLPSFTRTYDLVSGEDAENELLTDVLFELSPLEYVGWTRLLQADAEMLVARAIHLVQEDPSSWRLQVFFQTAPKETISTLFKEPTAVRFDWPSRQFQIDESNTWSDTSTNIIAATSLFVALAILCSLAPNERALAVLKKVPAVHSGLHYFVLRDPKTNEPSAGEILRSSYS